MADFDFGDQPFHIEKLLRVTPGTEVSIRVTTPTPSLTRYDVLGKFAKDDDTIIVKAPPSANMRQLLGLQVFADESAKWQRPEPLDIQISIGTEMILERILPTLSGQRIRYTFFYGEPGADLVYCKVDGWVKPGSCPHT